LFDPRCHQSQERKIFSAERLWAVALYANNEGSIDIVSPVCNRQRTFSHRCVMTILEQVKNTEEYKLDIKKFV